MKIKLTQVGSIRSVLFVVLLLISTATVVAQPSIDSFTPESEKPGTAITIYGNGFSSTPSNNTVYFGTVAANVTAASLTELTVTVPIGAQQNYISIEVNGAIGYSQKQFVPVFDCGGQITTSLFVYDSGPGPNSAYDAVFADFDGDGNVDMVTSNSSTTSSPNIIQKYLNNSAIGNISFSSEGSMSTNSEPESIAYGDLDGDGLLDIVVGHNGSNNLSIYRNISTAGNITFDTKIDLSSNAAISDVAIGNITNDGKPEILVTCGSSVHVYKNNSTVGSISFGAYFQFSVGATAERLALGDIDLDGKVDVITASRGNNTVSILRNTSTATQSFESTLNFAVGTGPYGVAVGDLDNDGKLDIVTNNYSTQNVSVFRNLSTVGSISLDTKQDFAVTAASFDVKIADLDGDAKADLITSRGSVLKNSSTVGTISFAASTGTMASSGLNVSVADLDGDGKSDFAIVGQSSNSMTIRRSEVFAPIISSTTPGSVCGASGSTTVSASASSGSIKWYDAPTGGTLLHTGDDYNTPVISATTSYYAEAVDGSCVNPAREEVEATVSNYPTMNAISNKSGCENTWISSTSFSSTPAGSTYSWDNDNTSIGLAASGTGNQPSFIGANPGSTPISGVVSVTPTLNGCVGTPSSYTVTVNPLPGDATTITGTNVLCKPSSGISFSVPTVTSATSYTWNFSGLGFSINTGSGTENITANFDITATDGDLTVSGTNTCGNGNPSPAFSITLDDSPSTSNAGPDVDVCVGYDAYMNADAPTVGTGSWSQMSGAVGTIADLSDPYTSISDLSLGVSIFRWTTSNGSCPDSFDDVNVTVNGLPNSGLTMYADDSFVCPGDGTNINIDVSESGVDYQLRNDADDSPIGSPVSGTGGTIILPTYGISSATTFNVYATNSSTGCGDQLTNTVAVNTYPSPAANAGSDLDFCQTPTLTGIGGSPTGSGGTSGYSYNWAPATGLSSTTASNPNANPSSSTTYYVSVTDANGCVAVDFMDYYVHPLSVAGSASPSSQNVCGSESFGVSLSGYTGAIDWEESTDLTTWTSTGYSFSPLNTTVSESTYFRAVVTSGNCTSEVSNEVYVEVDCFNIINGSTTACEGQFYDDGGVGADHSQSNYTFTIQPSGASQVSMTFTSLDLFDNTFAGSDAEIFIYNGPNNGSPLLGSWTLTSLPNGGAPIVANSGTMTINFDAGSGTGTDGSGWEASWVSDVSNGYITNDNPEFCLGESGTLTLNDGSGTYQWQESNDGFSYSDVAGETSSTLSITPTDDTYYRVEILGGACGTGYTDPLIVTIDGTGFAYSDVESICGAGTAELTLDGYGGSIQWQESTDGETWTIIGGATNANETVAPTDLTLYQAEVTNSCGTNYSNEVAIKVGTEVTIGNGTNSNTNSTYPAPYGNYYDGAKHQILILAVDIALDPGLINSLAFNVKTAQGEPLTGYEIKLKHTGASSLANFDNGGGFTSVYGPETYTDVVGWNTHDFHTPFCWDGTSNVLAEICFNNTDYTNNAHVYYTTTGYNSVIYVNQDNNANLCNETSGTSSNKRPNMRLCVSNVAGDITPSTPNICDGEGVDFFTYGSFGDLQWQLSTDGGSVWNNLSGETDTELNVTPSSGDQYRVEVTDYGCVGNSVAVTTTANPVPSISATITDVTCFEDSDGTISLTVSSGTVPYSYSWSNGGNTAVIAGLDGGVFITTISDANACTVTDSYTITEPTELTGVVSSTDESCNSSCDGDATLIPSGGTLPYTYAWDDPSVQTTSTANSLCDGTYIVTATDANGCVYTDITSVNAPAALLGAYTIGGTTPDYATIGAAVNDLICKGVSGPVEFDIRSGTYTEQIYLTEIPGASAINSVTFQSETGDSTDVVIEHTASGAGDNYVVNIDGADYLVFRSLTLEAKNAVFGTIVYMQNNSVENTFIYCHLKGVNTSSVSDPAALVFSNTDIDDDFSLLYCRLTDGVEGIRMKGLNSGTQETNTFIGGNVFQNQSSMAIHLEFQNEVLVDENDITSNTINTSYTGIYCNTCDDNVSVQNNTIYVGTGEGNGIQMIQSTAVSPDAMDIINNMIQVGGNVNNSRGILLDNVDEANVFHNSINATGTSDQNAAFLMVNCQNITINNNVFAADEGYAISSDNSIFTSDYNDLFTNGTFMATYDLGPEPDLMSWQGVSGADNNSVNDDPQFYSNNDLHLTIYAPSSLVSSYDLTATVPYDIDGNTRNISPTMGADEPSYFYWVGNGGLWSDFGSHWATLSGGVADLGLTPTKYDIVVFDTNSLTGSGQIITIDVSKVHIKDILFMDVSRTPVFKGSGTIVLGQ